MNKTTWLYLTAEFGPVLAFFVAGRFFTFYTAVAILMAATFFACVLTWSTEKRLPVLPLVSAAFVLIGGMITLYFNNPDAIIFTDSLYYAFCAGVLGASLLGGRLLLKTLFEPVFAITDTGWRLLSWRWFWFMSLAAISNEIVRIFATPEFWIDYRFYKTVVVAVFAAYQITLTKKHRLEDSATPWGLHIHPPKERTLGELLEK